jgi:hypothetical protein
VIRLGLRLTLNGGREALVRLVILVASVGLGTGLLLIAVSGVNAVNHQNSRYAWFESSATADGHGSPEWWLVTSDYYDGQVIGRVDVAGTGSSSPVPPGLSRLPGPGQYYASPALAALLRSVPGDQLADRFPASLAGVLGNAALPAPNSLVAVVGYTPAALSRLPGAQKITAISTTPPSSCSNSSSCMIGVGMNAAALDLVLSVIALALLFPVLMFVGSATRLSAARREQRFAAMRLAGATPRQVSLIACVESFVAAVGGVLAGFGIFFLLRPPLAAIPFTGAPFFPGDLSLSLTDILMVGLGVPVAAALAALAALRRVNISPLGVSRRVTPRPPGAWRVLPLLAGIAELGWFFVAGTPGSTSEQTQAYVPGFLLVLIGLVLIGPWLTMVGARLAATRARRPASLIAARRLGDNPKAAFRAVSGLVLALFITTVAIVSMGTINGHSLRLGDSRSTRQDLVDTPYTGPAMRPPPASLLASLDAQPGVSGTMLVYTDPVSQTIPSSLVGLRGTSGFWQLQAGIVTCAQLDRVRVLGRCPAGAAAALFPQGTLFGAASAATVWPAATQPARSRLSVQTIVVGTYGSTAAIERARTILDNAYPGQSPPLTGAEIVAQSSSRTTEYQQLADVVVLAALPIAGCTLAASLAGGLAERRRPFSLLRLTGAPLGMLRHVVTLESAVPLLLVAVVSIGAGFGASALFLRPQLGYNLSWPDPAYYVMTLAGIVLSLAIIAATFPLLTRITGPDVARND